MERKHRYDYVDAPAMHLVRTKSAQIHRGARAHAKAVGADEPGLVFSTRRPRYPRVHGAVGFMAQPPASTWFFGIGLPAACERDVLVGKAKDMLVAGANVVGCLGALVIFGRAIQPPAL